MCMRACLCVCICVCVRVCVCVVCGGGASVASVKACRRLRVARVGGEHAYIIYMKQILILKH